MFTIDQVELHEKRVLLRADLNVAVENGEITSRQRIHASLDTIKYALQANAGVLVVSHFGRPREGQYDARYSLTPIKDELQNMLRQEVVFVKDWIEGVDLKPGEVILGENVRFLAGETTGDQTLCRRLARLCDVFVMDAFGAVHRDHASVSGVVEFVPTACLGLQCQKEIEALDAALIQPAKPVVAIVGGAKIDGKLQALSRLSKLAQTLIVGGGIANTFLAAQGFDVGRSLHEPELIGEAHKILAIASENGCEIPLPSDVIVAPSIDAGDRAESKPIAKVSRQDMILDIGPQTRERFRKIIANSKTVIWNGPVGAFEFPPFDIGTRAITAAIIASGAFSVAGGGDTLSALEQFGSLDGVSYASTGGGAFLEFVQGNRLPGFAALQQHAAQRTSTLRFSQTG